MLRIAAAEGAERLHRVDGAAARQQRRARNVVAVARLRPPFSLNHSTVSASSTSLQM